MRAQAWLGRRIYYGWIVVAITFVTLLVSSGVRSTPAILIKPLEDDLGWQRAALALGVSAGLLLYGFAGPVVGLFMDWFGPRRMMLLGLLVLTGSTAASTRMSALWHFTALWGVLAGLGTGIAASVLAATVASRWFDARRGLVVGIFGAATSAGQLVFVPLLMWLVVAYGWRASVLAITATVMALLPPILLLMRDRPADLGLRPYGATDATQPPASGARSGGGSNVMRRALRVPEFWLLSGSFFVCGATSNGLIGTHFVPHSIDNGIPEVTAASVLGLMGAMNFVGTIFSGWLTDRYDPRRLLAIYYSLRGLSLFLLPFVTDFSGLAIFAIVFGLDYIATVPPTVALCADIFGRRNVGTFYGWVFAAHQLGAAQAAYLGGLAHDRLGGYEAAFLSAGVLAIMGGLMALRVDRARRLVPGPTLAPALE